MEKKAWKISRPIISSDGGCDGGGWRKRDFAERVATATGIKGSLRGERANGGGKSLDVLSEVFDIPKMICANAATQWRKSDNAREKGKRRGGGERERTRGGCQRVLAKRGRQAKRAERKRERKRELEGSNRTSKLNVEIRVECLAR